MEFFFLCIQKLWQWITSSMYVCKTKVQCYVTWTMLTLFFFLFMNDTSTIGYFPYFKRFAVYKTNCWLDVITIDKYIRSRQHKKFNTDSLINNIIAFVYRLVYGSYACSERFDLFVFFLDNKKKCRIWEKVTVLTLSIIKRKSAETFI